MMTTTQNSIFPTLNPMQNDVEYKAAARIGQQQEGETDQCPAQGNTPAPAAQLAADQQASEGKPGQQGEDGFVVYGHQLGGQAQGTEGDRDDGGRQECKTISDQAQQQQSLDEQRSSGETQT